jgi:hypothetical protein
MGYTAKRKSKGKAKQVATPVVEQENVEMTDVAPQVEQAGESSSYLSSAGALAKESADTMLELGKLMASGSHILWSEHKRKFMAAAPLFVDYIKFITTGESDIVNRAIDSALIGGTVLADYMTGSRASNAVGSAASSLASSSSSAFTAGYEKAKKYELSFGGSLMSPSVTFKRKQEEVAKEDSKVAAQEETAKQPAKKRARRS